MYCTINRTPKKLRIMIAAMNFENHTIVKHSMRNIAVLANSIIGDRLKI
jgi:hypothetical protein